MSVFEKVKVDGFGITTDLASDAGGEGTAQAKLRKLTAQLDDLAKLIGEVQANPTADTVQDRLKRAVTSLEIIDDWDEADRAKVNPIVGQAGIAAGAGAVDVKTQRVVLATDDPLVAKAATETTLDKLVGTDALPGLSFVETITSPTTSHTTIWVDITALLSLHFGVEMQTAETGTGEVEFTNAADPNTTPPGANDIVRALTTTLAGSGLGGLDVSGFVVPCETWRWARVRFTVGATGDQTVKVTARGSSHPSALGIVPIAATITRDYGAALVRGVAMGIDTNGEPKNLKVDTEDNLFVRAVPDPASNAPGRTRFEAVLTHQSADATIRATPGPGKRIVITGYILSASNSSTVSAGQLHFKETDAAGAVKVPHSTPVAIAGANPPILQIAPTLAEPIKLAENVALFADVAGGTMTYSVAVMGYEEDV